MENEERRHGTDAGDPPWSFRGHDLSRTLAFSDGVFAFAATLLVLDLTLPAAEQGPNLEPYLTGSHFLSAAFAYGITFFVITLWWMGHHLVFSYLRRYDRRLIRMNGVFLLFIAVLPFATIVLNGASTGASPDNPAGIAFFSGVQVAAGTTLGAIWLYASGPGRLLAPNFPAPWRTYITRHTFTTPIVFALSIPLAFLNVTVAEGSWLLVFALPFVMRFRTGEPG